MSGVPNGGDVPSTPSVLDSRETQKWARHRGMRGKRKRPYERGDGSGGAQYDSTLLGTARHIRCDRCLRAYLPQHVRRVARWCWWCGNCRTEVGGGAMLAPRFMLRREAVPR